MNKETLVHPFDPVADENSEVLILGSFPSVVSRRQNFYYANKGNRFWKVLSELFNEEVTDRRLFVLKHGIALWDVIESCTIQGSSDASIRNVTVNDIAGLIRKTKIHTVFTTGKKAGELYEKYAAAEIEHINLPSTSGANASYRLEDLVKAYSVILEKLNEKKG